MAVPKASNATSNGCEKSGSFKTGLLLNFFFNTSKLSCCLLPHRKPPFSQAVSNWCGNGAEVMDELPVE